MIAPGLITAGRGAVVAAAPAKLNLFLEVVGRRPDGFHELETLMIAVGLFDTLELADDATGSLTLTCDPPGLPTGPGNLVHRAAAALRNKYRPHAGATIALTKRVPEQAGMGGGSSDAASTLLALNELWKLNVPPAELDELAAGLGSDVNFFLGPSAAWCTGRGEVITPVPAGGVFDFVVVKPAFGLSTADVFRCLKLPAVPIPGDAVRAAVAADDPVALAASTFNRLQDAAVALRPELGSVVAHLEACGPLAVRLTGSGSAVFAVCRDRLDAARVATTYRETRPAAGPADRVFVVRSLIPASRIAPPSSGVAGANHGSPHQAV